jgi:hypothetical protein
MSLLEHRYADARANFSRVLADGNAQVGRFGISRSNPALTCAQLSRPYPPTPTSFQFTIPRPPSALAAQAGARAPAFAGMALPPPPSAIGRRVRADSPDGVHANGGPPQKRLRASREIPVSAFISPGTARAYPYFSSRISLRTCTSTNRAAVRVRMVLLVAAIRPRRTVARQSAAARPAGARQARCQSTSSCLPRQARRPPTLRRRAKSPPTAMCTPHRTRTRTCTTASCIHTRPPTTRRRRTSLAPVRRARPALGRVCSEDPARPPVRRMRTAHTSRMRVPPPRTSRRTPHTTIASSPRHTHPRADAAVRR